MSATAHLAGVDPHGEWLKARNVLAVRLDNLGDVLMCTPAMAAIHQSLPEAHLSLLASVSGAALAPFLPFLHETLSFQAPWTKQRLRPNVGSAVACRELIGRLEERKYDAAVIFTCCTQSALPAATLCMLAGIPLRLAFSRENPYGLLSHWVPETDVLATHMRHEVARQLALVEQVGLRTSNQRLVFKLRTQDVECVSAHLDQAGLAQSGAYFVVHPGASAPSRRYAPDKFAKAADRLARLTGYTPIFTGDETEVELIGRIRAAMTAGSLCMAGRLSLGELGALIRFAKVLLTNNTGPAHLAAALNTPVVDLYALTNPQHTPWQVASRVLNHDVPCRNCLKSVCPHGHHDCLQRVTPEAVVTAALELMPPVHRAPPRPLATAHVIPLHSQKHVAHAPSDAG